MLRVAVRSLKLWKLKPTGCLLGNNATRLVAPRLDSKSDSPFPFRNRVPLGEPILFLPKSQSPVVDGSAVPAPAPSSRSIPNNAKHFRTVPFSAPCRGEWSASPRLVRSLPFPPDFSPTPENARAWLTQPSSRFTFFEFPAYVYSSVPLARSTRQRNDRKADFRCGANPHRGEPS
jgi:hypothetical protein